MNVRETKTEKLPYLPKISSHKQSKVITKHFTNLVLYMPIRKLALLTWLIYEADADNSFKFSTNLLKKYSAAILAARHQYGGDQNLPTSIQITRKYFKELVNDGYIFAVRGRHIINPMLAYNPKQFKSYDKFVRLYENKDLTNLISFF